MRSVSRVEMREARADLLGDAGAHFHVIAE